MRCDLCPLSDPEDTCPEAEGKFGIEHKDGMLGCKHPKSWVEKRDEEYSNHLGAMGLDMGIEMDMPADELPECLFTVHRDERGATYHLTKTGLEWLGRQLHITITRR